MAAGKGRIVMQIETKQKTLSGGGTATWVGRYDMVSLSVAQVIIWSPRENVEQASERRWQESFAASQDFLKEWGDRVLTDFLAGTTEPLDPDNL
jgi:hypothetical protein